MLVKSGRQANPVGSRLRRNRLRDHSSKILNMFVRSLSRMLKSGQLSWSAKILFLSGLAACAMLMIQCEHVSNIAGRAFTRVHYSTKSTHVSSTGRNGTRMLSSLSRGARLDLMGRDAQMSMKVFQAPLRRGSGQAIRIYSDSKTRSPALCRIPKACLDTDGTMYVPDYLRMYKHIIHGRCRISESQVVYYNENNDHIMHSPQYTARYPGTHVLGPRPLRYHMPHLLDDFVSTVLVVAKYLQRETFAPWKAQDRTFHPPNTTVHCFDPNEPGFGDDGMPCASNPPRKIGILVEDRAQAVRWSPGFFKLLGTDESKAPLEVLYENEIFPTGDPPGKDGARKKVVEFRKRQPNPATRACFGSISVKASYQRITPDTIQHNVLFSHSGIQRVLPTFKPHQKCKLNITILNRPKTSQLRGFPIGARSIQNIEEVIKSLENKARSLGIVPNVQVHDKFGEVSFTEQFAVMQNTQVLISVHGAELSNGILLRRGVRAVEIFPFRYTPDIFANQMRSFGMYHIAYVAHPDEQGYGQCVRHFNPPGSPTKQAAELAISRFESRGRSYRRARSESVRQGLGAFWDDGSTVHALRPCARSQRLVVDSNLIAHHALKDCARLCYGEARPK